MISDEGPWDVVGCNSKICTGAEKHDEVDRVDARYPHVTIFQCSSDRHRGQHCVCVEGTGRFGNTTGYVYKLTNKNDFAPLVERIKALLAIRACPVIDI
jgi:hypothetical protein